MSHYLKLVMDAIFGRGNFENEIIWCYKLGGRPRKGWPRKHDSILFYRAGEEKTFNDSAIRVPYDSTGGYISTGRKIVGGKEYYVNPYGKVPEDWWPIPALNRQSKERTKYPTQKPLKLLERMIKASSNKGDIVLDPFCGCATTCVAAELHGREWVGIDVSPKAAELVRTRIENNEIGNLFYRGVNRADIPQRTDIKPLRKYNHKGNKTQLYGEQGGNCNGCKEHFLLNNLTVDHIIPKSKGY